MKRTRRWGPGEKSDPADAAGSVAVEEVFLEGENAVILHHSAGSDRASRLLEDSGLHELLSFDDD